jgi:general L-amino acid transport system substrate-binding protein
MKTSPNESIEGAPSRPSTDRRTTRVLCAIFTIVCACGVAVPRTADAADTLAGVKARDTVRCGVSNGIVGFSQRDAAGRWSGIDVDFCRAVAAAVLGNADKATFVPLRASERFPTLRLGTIDLLLRNTTWTLGREAGLGVLFTGVLLYDGEGFMVAADSAIDAPEQLSGATVCLVKGTTHTEQFADWARAHGVATQTLLLDTVQDAATALFANRCAAYTSDLSTLASVRTTAPSGRPFKILAKQISKQPLGPAVRAGDDQWFTLVRWVLFALIAAEENNVTQRSVATLRDSADPVTQRMLGADRDLSRLLGIAPEWSLRAVQSVGNYGEMFERNLGRDSPMHLERGLNQPWNRGGIMYAPPLQ